MIGGGNPLPESIGGGRCLTERLYWAMRAAVGEHNYAPEDVPGTTVEGAWRWCRALAVAAYQSDERAACDAFFARCTDTIPVLEGVLRITASSASSDEDRRQAIIARMARGTVATAATLQADLQTVDTLFSIIYASQDYADVTEHGRAYEDYVPSDPSACGPAFGGGRSSTDWPNYSTNSVCLVQYGITAGAISAEQRRRTIAAQAMLNQALPAWVDWAIVVDPTGGFILDLDLLDLGAF